MRSAFIITIPLIFITACSQRSKSKPIVPYSIIKETFANGNPKIKYFYPDSSDKNTYKEIIFYESGNIAKEISRLDTMLDGTYKVYWDHPINALYYETINAHGKKTKFEKSFDSLGGLIRYDSLLTTCQKEPFTCDAIVRIFFSNGKLKKKYFQQNRKLNGFYISYHENGNIERLGNYTNGQENVTFISYDESGKYRQTLIALNGKREGKTDIIYADGVHGIGQFHNDKEEGKWIMIDTLTGKIIDSLFYHNGKTTKFPKQ